MDKITLVTAFFDIGRENFKAIPRDNKKYFDQFRFWARIKNGLIVFTEKRFKDEIMAIRTEFGVGDQTTIIVVDNLFMIEPEIHNRMIEIANNQWFTDFRFLPNATSNIANYSYLMLMKSWCIKTAVEKGLTHDTVAWIDFGFNHGGDLYTRPEEFAFEWRYTFEPKINLYYYQKYDEKPIFEIVRRLCDCFMGCLIVLPKNMSQDFWIMNKKSMEILNCVDLIDDDQLILMLSYRMNPGKFHIEKSDWFLPLKEHGAPHLTTIDRSAHSKVGKYIIAKNRKKRKKKLVKQYISITRKNLMEKD